MLKRIPLLNTKRRESATVLQSAFTSIEPKTEKVRDLFLERDASKYPLYRSSCAAIFSI